MSKKVTLFKSVYLYNNEERKIAEKSAKENILANDEELTEADITDEMVTDTLYNDETFTWECEKDNLYKKLSGNIIAIADCGLWYGRKTGCKVMGNNLNEVLTYFNCDYANIYATKRGVYGEFYHHDGVHYVEFRELKNSNISSAYDVNFDLSKRRSITRHTKNLSPYVNEVYGCFN